MAQVIQFPVGYASGLEKPLTAKCRKAVPMPMEAIFEPEPDSETALYRAVLLQVITDIASKSGADGVEAKRQEAELWLKSSMFEQVCAAAGFTMDYVRSRIQVARARDFQWRRGA